MNASFFGKRKVKYTTGEQLGYGQEAKVYRILGRPNHVAKVYNQIPSPEKTDVLLTLRNTKIKGTPDLPIKKIINGAQSDWVVFAWPTDLLYDSQGQLVGYVMPRIQADLPINRLARGNMQEKLYGQPFSLDLRLFLCQQLATAFHLLHSSNIVVGDMNPRNFVFSQGPYLTLLDCDSFHIQDASGRFAGDQIYFPDNSAPELLQAANQAVALPFSKDADLYSLAIFMFLLLMDGHSPFSGCKIPPEDVGPDFDVRSIIGGAEWYPYNPKSRHGKAIPELMRRYQQIPRQLRHMLDCVFTGRVSDRPTAKEWVSAVCAERMKLIGKVSAPEQIEKTVPYVSDKRDKPLHVIFLIDNSGSMKRHLPVINIALEKMLKTISASDVGTTTEIAVLPFSEECSKKSLISAHEFIFFPIASTEGRTDFSNAFHMAVSILSERQDQLYTTLFHRPKVFVFTDGIPTKNGTLLDKATKELKAIADVISVAVGNNLCGVEKEMQGRYLKRFSSTNEFVRLSTSTDFMRYFEYLSTSVVAGHTHSITTKGPSL